MSSTTPDHTQQLALHGPLLSTFIRYLVPSMLGLLAMTSATVVDGIFVGNYVGVTALAALNLIMPIISLLFGIALMLAVGGSVRAGKYLGEGNLEAASAIFSKIMISVLLYGLLVIALALVFERQLYQLLGAGEELFPVMSEYFRVFMPFLLPQLITVVLYFFIRLDGFPTLAAVALAIGSLLNILLDYLLLAILDWGLAGAAYATGASQVIQCVLMSGYFFHPTRRLLLRLRQRDWREVLQAAYNGISDFVNEVSGNLIAFMLNWMLLQRAGVEGVAAISIINYLLIVGFLMFFSMGDASQVMLSQNFGARNVRRMQQFLNISFVGVAILAVALVALLVQFNAPLISWFIDDNNQQTLQLAQHFVGYMWPMLLFAGGNMVIASYLTAVHCAFLSGVVALFRSLILPALLLAVLFRLFADYRFMFAFTLAEAGTFVLAVVCLWGNRPARVVSRMASP